MVTPNGQGKFGFAKAMNNHGKNTQLANKICVIRACEWVAEP